MGKVLKCPICGATDLEHKDNLVYQCKYCSTVFEIPRGEGVGDKSVAKSIEKVDQPLFLCVGCEKQYFKEKWHMFSKTSFQNKQSTMGKKIAVSYDLFYCPNCHGFVCIRCIKEGRFNKVYCGKCDKRLEVINGFFIVKSMDEVPEMFGRVFQRHKGKC